MTPRPASQTPIDAAPPSARGLRFALVVSRFHEPITVRLLVGARDALKKCGAEESNIAEVWVPGAWEIPLACQALAKSGRYDALICLGCVIRGETAHFEFVAGEASHGVAQVSLTTGVPIGFGLLTTETLDQAIERSGGTEGNKGSEAALAAIEMVGVVTAARGAKAGADSTR